MKIEIGKMNLNRTWKYLGATFYHYGSEFTDKLNTVFKLAAGIGDTLHEKKETLPYIYLLCDAKYQPRNFERVLTWFKYHPEYVTDYPYDPDLKDVRRHMIVFRLPEKAHKAYDKFLDSKYSEMFTKEEVNIIFEPERRNITGVLLKKEKAFQNFVDITNQKYGTKVPASEVSRNQEYDLPINLSEEIFNYE